MFSLCFSTLFEIGFSLNLEPSVYVRLAAKPLASKICLSLDSSLPGMLGIEADTSLGQFFMWVLGI